MLLGTELAIFILILFLDVLVVQFVDCRPLAGNVALMQGRQGTSQNYFRFSRVDFEIDFLKAVPVVDDVIPKGFPLQGSVEQLPYEIVVWPFVELYRTDVVDQIDKLKGHFVAQHLRSQSFFQLLSREVHFLAFLGGGKGTSAFLAQGNFPSRR